MELSFAFLISLGGLCILYRIMRPLAYKLRSAQLWGWIMAVFLLKFWFAFTMGHLDITRFIIFLQQFVAHPLNNPWNYNPRYPHADFPYPPLLLYLHAIPFFAFKPLISNSPVLDPSGFAYTLFRIPLVLFDLWWFKEVLSLRQKDDLTPFRNSIFSYLLCTVILFHQYYSGQLDLIAVVPFFVSCLDIEYKGKLSWKAFALISLSLCLKPFAIIFLPFVFLRLVDLRKGNSSKQIKSLLSQEVLLAGAILIFKFSELPYLLTDSYRSKMGAGAAIFYQHNAILGATVFPLIYLVYTVFTIKIVTSNKKQYTIFFHLLMVTLLMGSTTQHSAGWMLWGCAAYFILQNNFTSKVVSRLWWTWNLLFILRWSLVSHSPIADSIGIFLKKFLHLSTNPPMGYLHHALVDSLGLKVANKAVHLSEVLFVLASACFGFAAFKYYQNKPTEKENKTSIPLD